MQNMGLCTSVSYSIVEMEERHRGAVVDLFNYYVRSSFAAYPDVEAGYEFFDTLKKMCHEHGTLVVETQTGQVVAFALLRPYHPASTFARTAEVSYYLLPEHTRKGLGRKLLERLIEIAKARDIHCLVASVSSRNEESLQFHRRWGFEECGQIRDIGVKFGQSFGVVWYRREI